MGEKDGKKEEKSDSSIVLKLDMHCEGCMTKILKTTRSIAGVDRAAADWEASKLTVKGKIDPSKLREELQKRTKKKVEIISPQAKKEKENSNNAEKKPNEKKADEKKSDEKKSKEPQVTTAVLKMHLHCAGCVEKICKIASKFKGVDKVSIDKEKDLVTVSGKMDANALVQSLSEKMKRSVEIVPPKKDKENSTDGKEGGKKKGGGDGAVEGNRLEYVGFPGYPPVPVPVPAPAYGPGYAYPYAPEPAYSGYPFLGNPHPPQVFSDENPNACSIM